MRKTPGRFNCRLHKKIRASKKNLLGLLLREKKTRKV
jgi:hypothetical protein